MQFQTEVEFKLPRGYMAADGEVHRDGVMRLATAGDEASPENGAAPSTSPAASTCAPMATRRCRLASTRTPTSR